VIIGIDPGERRVGVAIADLETRFARPLEVIDSKVTDPVERIAALVAEHEALRIVVGRPVSLSGVAGAAVDAQQKLVVSLKDRVDVEIVEYDERLTTVIANRALRDAGRSSRDSKAMRDAVAAQILLQDYLDSTR
jgi:putative Holliday junction resolvase